MFNLIYKCIVFLVWLWKKFAEKAWQTAVNDLQQKDPKKTTKKKD